VIGNEKLHHWTREFERLLDKHPVCLTKICFTTVYREAAGEREKFTTTFRTTLSSLQISAKFRQKDLFN